MRTAIAILAIILITLSTASASTLEAVCDAEADYALGSEDYPEAIRLHQQLIALHPGNALAHYHLGFAYGMMGRRADEIDEYVAAIALGDNDWDLYLNLGLAYLEDGKMEKSIESFKDGVAIDGSHYELHFDLAVAYERSGRFSEALPEISAALRLNPGDLEIYNMQAAIYAELGDFGRARAEWTTLTRAAPDYVPARHNLELLDGLCDEGSGLPGPIGTRRTVWPRTPAAASCLLGRSR
ncbi:MAG TPA: tetratricopeptide repeat protein [Candidatus Binataceae bacterium]|jgi:tetratricopeptide (TPR) repeat protein|nr:tetratricopeptide repeat protein [Candidatus Binataceae bacterium]